MRRWNRIATGVLLAALVFSMVPAGVLAAPCSTLRNAASFSGVGKTREADVDYESQAPATGQNETEENSNSGEIITSSDTDTVGYDHEVEISTDEQTDANTEMNITDWSGNNDEAVTNNNSEELDSNVNFEETDSAAPVQSGEEENSENVTPDEDYSEASEKVNANGEPSESEESDAENTLVNIDPASEPIDTANGESVLYGEAVGAGEISIDLGDLDTLYADYANRMFYGAPLNPGKKMLKGTTAGRRLDGQNLTIYNLVKSAATDIADGNLDTAIVQIPLESLGLQQTYTTGELGVGDIYDSANGGWQDNNIALLKEAVGSLFTYDLSTIMHSLFADCPYELYWSSGSMGSSGRGYKMSYDNTITFEETYVTFTIGVDSAYALEGGGEYDVDTEKTSSARIASENAQKIVSNADGMSDYYRLNYYMEQICDLVVYNDEAAADMKNYPDRGPWALIYVFDGRSSTNVVCEGYSEAFQYLCDLSEFQSSEINVYSVTGDMDGGTGAGPHKWNIVHMEDGNNYIADITNSDEGSIGSDGKLFLKGMSGNVSDGYVKNWEEWQETWEDEEGTWTSTHPAGSITYIYDEETRGTFSDADLQLSANDYGVIAPESADDKAVLKGMSLFLTDRIGMEVYVKPVGETALSDDDYIEFTYAGKTVVQNVSEAERTSITDYNGDTIEVLKFELELWTKQMTDDVSFHMVVDGVPGQDKVYSIRDYADAILRGDYPDEEKEMVRSMLNFGGYAQACFSYNTEELANTGLFEEGENPAESEDPDLSDYDYSLQKASDTQGFHIKEATLALGTDVYVLFYYRLDEGMTPEDYSFSLIDDSGKELVSGYDENRGMNYVMIPRILPYELSNMYTFTVTPKNGTDPVVTLNYGPYSYLKAKINRETPTAAMENLKLLCKAMYHYCETAKTLKDTQ